MFSFCVNMTSMRQKGYPCNPLRATLPLDPRLPLRLPKPAETLEWFLHVFNAQSFSGAQPNFNGYKYRMT